MSQFYLLFSKAKELNVPASLENESTAQGFVLLTLASHMGLLSKIWRLDHYLLNKISSGKIKLGTNKFKALLSPTYFHLSQV